MRGIQTIMLLHKFSFQEIELTTKKKCEVCNKKVIGRVWRRLMLVRKIDFRGDEHSRIWRSQAVRCYVHTPPKRFIYPHYGDMNDEVLNHSGYSLYA